MDHRLIRLSVPAFVVIAIMAAPVPAQQGTVEQDLTASTLSVYTPPTCVPGVPFSDITCTTGFDPWIEQFGLDGITSGCGGGKSRFFPVTSLTRATTGRVTSGTARDKALDPKAPAASAKTKEAVLY